MAREVVFLEDQPVITVDRQGVKITYTSGDEVYARRCSVEFMRAHAANIMRAINEYDAAERAKVVRLPRRGRAKH